MKTEAPVKSPFVAEQEKVLRAWTTHYPYPIMGLLEALRQVQIWKLCVSPEDEDYLARLFDTTRTRVHELVTFFPFFTRAPTGRKRIGLCRGISCALAGSDKMTGCLEKTLGVAQGVTTKDGEFSWEEMECLGACDFAPALIVNEELQGQATQDLIGRIAKR